MVNNFPGSVYIGQLTGPVHQVQSRSIFHGSSCRFLNQLVFWGGGVLCHIVKETLALGWGGLGLDSGLISGARKPKVHHQATRSGDSLWEPDNTAFYSVAIMFRTALFPKCRARLRDTTPSPPELLQCLAEVFRRALADLPWRMPSLAECVAVLEASVRAQPPPGSLRTLLASECT